MTARERRRANAFRRQIHAVARERAHATVAANYRAAYRRHAAHLLGLAGPAEAPEEKLLEGVGLS